MSKIFGFISAAFGLAAAVTWLVATFKKVPHKDVVTSDGDVGSSVTVQDGEEVIDPFATAELQNKWNAIAAALTGVAMLFQALSTATSH